MVSLRQQLLHAAGQRLYDPAARRERYLRERQLKGRAPASFDQPGPTEPKATSPPAGFDKPGADKAKGAPPVTPERVAALKVRLEQLKELLSKLSEQAKVEAGGEPTPKKTDPAEKTAEKEKPKEKTAAEKKEEAKNAKERRDKESKTTPKGEAASVKAQIESIKNQIEDMRAKLAAARKAASTKKPAPKPISKSDFKAADSKPSKQPTALDGRHH